MKKVALVITVLLLLSLVSGCGSPPPNKITMSGYTQLTSNMTYSQACSTLGAFGVEMSSSEMPGIPGVMAPIKTVLYVWQNPDGSNMNAMFQNDRLISKAQLGLK